MKYSLQLTIFIILTSVLMSLVGFPAIALGQQAANQTSIIGQNDAGAFDQGGLSGTNIPGSGCVKPADLSYSSYTRYYQCVGAQSMSMIGPSTWNILTNEQKQDNLDRLAAFNINDPAKRLEAINEQAKKEGQEALRASSSCWATEGLSGSFFKCLWYSLMAFIGSIPVSIGALVLSLAGLLFNWLVDATIIQFSTSVYGPAKDGIEQGWQMFRDLANILIIGMFVFIAISLILGVEKFGNRRLIVNALIVAIFINFSLLFTKLIIDASNFTAFQVHQAAVFSAATGNPGFALRSDQLKKTQEPGIAGSFLISMGIPTVGDSYNTVYKVAETQNSGWIAVAYGLLVGIFLFAAALVLFYGCFLLLSRAILFIFLLITSSLAFASYLVPKLADRGWSVWWNSLLRNAVLAPLLMIFLLITLTIAAKLNESGASLGSLATNPQATLGIKAIFNYLLILGLLFASFRISSSFAGSIVGFNWAAILPATGVAALSRTAGRAGRGTLGWVGLRARERLEERAALNLAEKRGVRARMQLLGARVAGKFGKFDYNLMRTPFGKGIADVAGIRRDTLAGRKVSGQEGVESAKRERFAETGERLGSAITRGVSAGRITADDLRQAALAGNQSLAATHKSATEEHSAAERERDIAAQERERVARDEATLQNNLAEMQRDRAEYAQQMDRDLQQLQQERASLSRAEQTPEAQNRLREVEDAIINMARRRTELDEQDRRIRDTQLRLGEVRQRREAAEQVLAQASQRFAAAQANLARSTQAIDTEVKKRTGAAGLAQAAAHYRISNLPWVLAGQTEEQDAYANSVRNALRARTTNRRIREALAQDVRAAVQETQASTQAAPAAPAAEGSRGR